MERSCIQWSRSSWPTTLKERLTVILRWRCSRDSFTNARTGTPKLHLTYLIARGRAISTFSVCMDSSAIMDLTQLTKNSSLSFEELRVEAIKKLISMNLSKLLNQYSLKCMTSITLKTKESILLEIMISMQKTLAHFWRRCKIHSQLIWLIQ